MPGNEFKPEAASLPGETVIVKRTNSAFIGTDLEASLRRAGHRMLIIAGVITNNSVEATVRMAGNLGFAEVHAMSLANLDREYCRVVGTKDVLDAVAA